MGIYFHVCVNQDKNLNKHYIQNSKLIKLSSFRTGMYHYSQTICRVDLGYSCCSAYVATSFHCPNIKNYMCKRNYCQVDNMPSTLYQDLVLGVADCLVCTRIQNCPKHYSKSSHFVLLTKFQLTKIQVGWQVILLHVQKLVRLCSLVPTNLKAGGGGGSFNVIPVKKKLEPLYSEHSQVSRVYSLARQIMM